MNFKLLVNCQLVTGGICNTRNPQPVTGGIKGCRNVRHTCIRKSLVNAM